MKIASLDDKSTVFKVSLLTVVRHGAHWCVFVNHVTTTPTPHTQTHALHSGWQIRTAWSCATTSIRGHWRASLLLLLLVLLLLVLLLLRRRRCTHWRSTIAGWWRLTVWWRLTAWWRWATRLTTPRRRLLTCLKRFKY